MNYPAHSINDWIQYCGLSRLEARLLLQHFAGLNHSYLITHGDELLSAANLDILNAMAERRRQGEPMAYIMGYREFYGRSFTVSSAVLIPRPETEHLVEAALGHLPDKGVVWELGTGSGIIAVTLASERPDATIWATDISASALDVARHNARQYHTAIHFGEGSWYSAAPRPPKGSVDLIVSNPPYIEQHDPHLQQGDLRFEPKQALTDFADGLQAITEIIHTAPQWLNNRGWLLLEHGFDQGAAVRQLLQQRGFMQVQTLPDLAGLDRVSLGQWLKPDIELENRVG